MIENLMYEFYQLPALYEKIALEAGDNFNLFELLVSRDNEAMHSKFIGELLNPSGSHGQGYTFLKLFVDYLKIEIFDTETAKLYLEYHISSKTDTEGGRIDIFIQDKNGVSIAIENKIWAGDQDAQLLRYYNFIKNNSNSRLLYLNLSGNEAQEHSTKGEKFPYQIISYKEHILAWLHLCREKATNLPILRESISQYINLIKSLTHQTNNAKMNNEIAESIVSNPEKLTAYLNLVDNKAVKAAVDYQMSVRSQILEKLNVDLQKIADEKELELTYDLVLNKRWQEGGFYFSNDKLKSLNICVGYIFDEINCRNLVVGFFYIDRFAAKPGKLEQIIKGFCKEFNTYLDNDWWLCYKYHTHKDWGSAEFEIINNGQMAELISKEVDIMLSIINSIE